MNQNSNSQRFHGMPAGKSGPSNTAAPSSSYHKNHHSHHHHSSSCSSSYNKNNYNNANNANRQYHLRRFSPLNNDEQHHQQQHQQQPFLLSTLYKLFIAFLSTLCLLGLTTTLLILYLSVRPFSIPTYRRLAANIGAAAWIDAMALLLPNMKLHLTGDSDVPSPVGASVLVCNHSMDGDWWALLMLCRCVGLRGSVKAFLQREANAGGGITVAGAVSGPDGNNPKCPHNNGSTVAGGAGVNGLSSSIVMSSSAPVLANAQTLGNAVNNVHHTASSTNATTINSNNPTPLIRNHSMGPAIFQNHAGVGSSGASSANITNNNSTTNTATNNDSSIPHSKQSQQMSLAQYFLHTLLEFPLLSSENNKNYIQDRNELFTLLRSFAHGGAPAPVHLLLFPEGWSLEGDDRQSMLAKSVEFAKREGRPLLKNLLLPRTTGFYASLDSLRESSPVVYDVTIAYRGYDGKKPFSFDVTWPIIKRLVTGQIPSEIYIHIRRYSSMEVLADAKWLDKQWAEKDRLLTHFSRHQQFPTDNRGFCKHRVFDTRLHSVESSMMALLRLGMIPFAIPIILLLAIPLIWMVLWCWLAHRAFILLFPEGIASLVGDDYHDHSYSGMSHHEKSENGSVGEGDAAVTPFFPATPFASPNIWPGNGDSQPGQH